MAAPKSYDVFLSFRGEDTRCTFTDHLYQALVKRGIRTFRDEQLRRGEAIAPELLKEIEDSRSSVIIFSENYAHSRWCLDELVKIMDCKKDLGHTVFPIFYHVDPSHVRNQTGRFGEAFAGYEENWKDKVGRWRTALREAGNLSGWHLQPQVGYESNHITKITNRIFRQLNCKRLDVHTNLVGIDSRINKVNLLLDMGSNDIRMIGIYGVGGIGKTTISKVIYNELSREFECMSFLENIGEICKTEPGLGLRLLENQLCADGVRGATIKQKVFIVLDDVDHSKQLECLLGNRRWLGEGSRVIITTRNKHLLTVQVVDDTYEVPGLNFGEAEELFNLYAFQQNVPKLEFINLSHRMLYYCQGLPLALKVLGSLLFNKTTPQWESELQKLKREPEMQIHNVLKRSCVGLGRTEKNILLDVACFFGDEDKDFVSRILDGCNFHPIIGLQKLNDMCLLNTTYKLIYMHGLIREMAWEIVREGCRNMPNKWSRSWDPHHIDRALTTYKGIDGVETLSLDLRRFERVRFDPNVLSKMTSLRLLKIHSAGIFLCFDWKEVYDYIIENASKMELGPDFKFSSYELRYLCWDGYPLEFLPRNFDGVNLIALHLKCSNIKRLWHENKDLERLKVVDMSYSKKLIQMPEFSTMPNLEELNLQGCVSLIDIQPSIGVLKKLTTLDLKGCVKLKGLPSSIIDLQALVVLDLSECSSFDKFPEIQGNMRSLKKLRLGRTAIRELPNGIDLESIEILNLDFCSKFEKFPENGANMKSLKALYFKHTAVKELPTGIANWESLPSLDLSRCSKFKKFPEHVGNMKRLWELYLDNTAIKDLPDSIGDLEYLKVLDLSNCSKFEKFPETIGNLKCLKVLCLKNTAVKDLPDRIVDLECLDYLDLSNCSKFEKFPEKIENMKRLRGLRLNNTAVKNLPDSIGDLESLVFIDISNCSKLEKFPNKKGNMKILRGFRLNNTAVKNLSDSIGDLKSLFFIDISQNTAIKGLSDSIGDSRYFLVPDSYGGCSWFKRILEDLIVYYGIMLRGVCGTHEESSGNHWRSSDDSKADSVEEEPRYESLREVMFHEENNLKGKRSRGDEAEAVELEEPLYKRFGGAGGATG